MVCGNLSINVFIFLKKIVAQFIISKIVHSGFKSFEKKFVSVILRCGKYFFSNLRVSNNSQF